MPTLNPTQARVASERRELASHAADLRHRQYIDVGRATGVPPQMVEAILEEWTRRFGLSSPESEPERPKGPPKPTIPTEQMRADRIKTVVLHLMAMEALFRLLEPETARNAAGALQATKDALARWREVQNGSSIVDEGSHTRACGWKAHPHGPDCHPNCPTCGGKSMV